jgi:hypothetical protein
VWTPATREILRAIDAKARTSGTPRDAVEGSGGDRHHAEEPRQRVLGHGFGDTRPHALAVTGGVTVSKCVRASTMQSTSRSGIRRPLQGQAQFRCDGRALQLQHVDEVHLRGDERAARRRGR